jgi:hypothetical protein
MKLDEISQEVTLDKKMSKVWVMYTPTWWDKKESEKKKAKNEQLVSQVCVIGSRWKIVFQGEESDQLDQILLIVQVR